MLREMCWLPPLIVIGLSPGVDHGTRNWVGYRSIRPRCSQAPEVWRGHMKVARVLMWAWRLWLHK